MGTNVRAARPRGTVEQIKQRAGDAADLLAEYRTVLEPRMPAGMIDGLATDLASVGGVVPNALTARVQKKAATQGERTTAKDVVDHVGSIRELIRHAFSDKATQKAWGVGQKVDAKVTKRVLAAGTVILDRAAAAPQEARDAGILDDDIARLTTQLSSLQGADELQGTQGRSSKGATAARDATLVRLETAVRATGLRGRLAFLADKATRASFEALLAPYSTAPKKPGGGGGGSGGGGGGAKT